MTHAKGTHVEFASRFNTACENSELIPPIRHGKLQKIVSLFAEQFSDTITIETPRKWQEGLAIPRGKRMMQLARILNVSPEWLEHGTESSSAIGGIRSEDVNSDPCALLLVGLTRLDQGYAAIPFGKIGVNIELRMGFDDVEGYATRAQINGNDLVFYIPQPAKDNVVFPVVLEGRTIRIFAIQPGAIEGTYSRLSHQVKAKLPLKSVHELLDLNAALPFTA